MTLAARHAWLTLVVGSLISTLSGGILPPGRILQPVAVSTTHAPDPFANPGGGTTVGDLTSTIDQSGFLTNYISGETEFDEFVATTVAFETADSIGGIGPGRPGEIDFDLGLINRIDAIAIWNRRGREGGPALREFDLLVSLTEDFADPIEIGSFVLSPVPDDFRMPAEVFSFEPVPARYVRILATQNDGHPQATQINEFAVRRAVFGSPDDLCQLIFGMSSAHCRQQELGVRDQTSCCRPPGRPAASRSRSFARRRAPCRQGRAAPGRAVRARRFYRRPT